MRRTIQQQKVDRTQVGINLHLENRVLYLKGISDYTGKWFFAWLHIKDATRQPSMFSKHPQSWKSF